MKENRKRELIGKVVSDKNDKTITVLVENYIVDKLYGKRVKRSKKYSAHDEKNEAKVGDVVRIVECRPLSKTKRYRLVEIIEKAVII
jgi:small subunit ribosomal protein S17